MIIAIDGPAGSGKSSTAREVARRLGFRHLDSGAFYRALTTIALEEAIPAEEWSTLTEEDLDAFQISARPADGRLELFSGERRLDAELRSPAVNQHVSAMASLPLVREWLLGQLREVARGNDIVADGRDIGTVVFPAAQLKIFLVADPETRARRRLAEYGEREPSTEEVRAEVERLSQRDRIDSEREIAPLREAEDAVRIDTTDLTFDAQVEKIVSLAESRWVRG